jgi:hypothetical protein
MQAQGLGFVATGRVVFEGGTLSGLKQLYRAWPPTVAMLAMRQGLVFGSGAALKKQLPRYWSEMMRDATAMGLSALVCTGLTFPMDTVKTRLQLGNSLPGLGQCYQGFLPAVSHAVVGRAIWMVTRNSLERNVPDPESPVLRYWKHFICGGLTGTMVTCVVFPMDTLKKRLQASDENKLTLRDEVRVLLQAGGLRRFYSGIQVKLAMNFAQGAMFNALFVACSKRIEAAGWHTK